MSARLAVLVLFAASGISAQEAPIATDRPGFLFSSLTVGRGAGQAELGLPAVTLDEGVRSTSLVGLFRFGVSDGLELRLGAPLFTSPDSGYGDLEVGAKWHLLDNEGARPSFALIPSVILPTGEDGFSAEVFDVHATLPDLALIGVGGVADGWGAGLLAGFLRGDSYLQQTFGALLGHTVGPWSPYVEVAHVRTDLDGAPDSSFLGGGLKYLVSNDIQIDVNFDRGLTGESPDWLFGLGLAARF